MIRNTLMIGALGFGLVLGCKEDDSGKHVSHGGGGAPATQAQGVDSHGHAHVKKDPIGTKSLGGYQVQALQSGPVKEGDFDVLVTGGPGKPKAVRFWVGVESGQGSVKAKAEEETPNNWHVHPEIPNPLPAGSQFWVEIEPPTGEKLKTSFDFKK